MFIISIYNTAEISISGHLKNPKPQVPIPKWRSQLISVTNPLKRDPFYAIVLVVALETFLNVISLGITFVRIHLVGQAFYQNATLDKATLYT